MSHIRQKPFFILLRNLASLFIWSDYVILTRETEYAVTALHSCVSFSVANSTGMSPVRAWRSWLALIYSSSLSSSSSSSISSPSDNSEPFIFLPCFIPCGGISERITSLTVFGGYFTVISFLNCLMLSPTRPKILIAIQIIFRSIKRISKPNLFESCIGI